MEQRNVQKPVKNPIVNETVFVHSYRPTPRAIRVLGQGQGRKIEKAGAHRRFVRIGRWKAVGTPFPWRRLSSLLPRGRSLPLRVYTLWHIPFNRSDRLISRALGMLKFRGRPTHFESLLPKVPRRFYVQAAVARSVVNNTSRGAMHPATLTSQGMPQEPTATDDNGVLQGCKREKSGHHRG